MPVKFHDISLAEKPLSDSGFTVGWTLQTLYDRSKEFRKALGENSVENVTVKPLGEGQGFVSVVYLVTVDLDDGAASPYSFVLKVPSTRHLDTFASETDNPEEARKGILTAFAKAHNGECAFYDAFNRTDSTPFIPMPRVWYTRRFEDESHLGAILMEDLSVNGTNPGIVNSVTVQQIKNVTTRLARFHAELLVNDVNTQGIEGSIVQIDDVFQALYLKGALALENEDPGFGSLFKKMAPVAIVEHSKYALFEYPKTLGLPLLLLHGDCWSNNLLFTRIGDGTASNDVLAFLDWQGVFTGNPMFDLATFLSQSADAEVRREAEGFIIDVYFDELSTRLKAAGKEVDFGTEALMKAYKSVFIAKAMETIINISLIEKTLSSPYEGVREAQMAKMKLRTKLVLEDAVRYIDEVAKDFLNRR